MSFSSETKNELARIDNKKKCCQLAEISGFFRMTGSILLVGNGRFKIIISTENPAVARHYKKMIQDYFKIDTELVIGESNSIRKGYNYMISIDPNMNSDSILRETGILLVREGNNYISDGIYGGIVKTKCCRKAYLRGCFLGSGSVTAPGKGYHLEFTCDSKIMAADLRKLINNFVDMNAKISERKGKYVVYMKNSQHIRDMLAIIGAHSKVLEYDNVIIQKDLVNQATRLTNCDNANTDRTLDASQKQIIAIKKIIEIGGIDSLTPKLKELAELRINNPEASLSQLGEMMSPPLKKSGVNNRMKRIIDFSERL